MYLRQKHKLIYKASNRVLLVAVLFTFGALVSAIARADVKVVEGLEFSQVQLVGDNELEISQGDTNTMKIRCDEDDMSPLPFIVQGDTLRLGVTERGAEVGDVKFKLTLASIDALLVIGSAEAFVKPLVVEDLLVSLDGSGVIRMFDLQAQDLELRVRGSGVLQAANVTARDARLKLKGSGDIQLGSLRANHIKAHMAGSGDISLENDSEAVSLEVRLLGSGDVSLKKLAVMEAKVSILGSGDVELRVDEKLEAEVLGSGDLTYFGNPSTSTSVLGSGDITRKDY